MNKEVSKGGSALKNQAAARGLAYGDVPSINVNSDNDYNNGDDYGDEYDNGRYKDDSNTNVRKPSEADDASVVHSESGKAE